MFHSIICLITFLPSAGFAPLAATQAASAGSDDPGQFFRWHYPERNANCNPISMNQELSHKLVQVRQLLQQHGAQAALIGKQSNFSWLACGGEAHIPLNTDSSFGQLLVTPSDFFVFANRIEMPRLQAEALKSAQATPLEYDWFDHAAPLQTLKKVADPKKTISDNGDWGTRAKPELFTPLRYSLQQPEINRYRQLGKSAEAAMEATCRSIEPGMSEFAITAFLAEECWNLNLTPVVLLVATDERIRRFRHPLPTSKKLKRHAMLVLCARQHGLIAALTRIVHFGKLPGDLRKRHNAVCGIDAVFQKNTRPGASVGEVFARGTEAYDRLGFKDEWKLHHQGGPCGYEARDYLASPTSKGLVQENQPFAWNPTITGAKSEDTILVTSKGIEILTASHDWPMVEVQFNGLSVDRPDIFVR
jgi:Xaa-Pro aminopeptidase